MALNTEPIGQILTRGHTLMSDERKRKTVEPRKGGAKDDVVKVVETTEKKTKKTGSETK